MRPGVRIVLAGAAAILLLPACYGSHTTIGSADGGADAPAGTCLEACTGPYTAGVIACHEEQRTCLLSCGGWDDHACSDPCETTWDACTYERDYEAERCMEDCPCWEPFMACTDGCDGGPGDDCWTACESGYGACSGDDITGMGTCLSGCAIPSMECDEACESHEGDWGAWVNCDAECQIAWVSCMGGCF
ncbi:MAG: hypothetical protein JRG91_01325 [Deltaproteobacteria bacterium]|nr:hypothetical protein [Deltaproteobacteria bacterium]